MSIYRGRLYSVADIQKLLINKEYKEELDNCCVVNEYCPMNDIFNLIYFSNVAILLGISRLDNDFISEKQFQLVYDKIETYVNHIDLLGYEKVYNKIVDEVLLDMLRTEPFTVDL